MDEKVNIQVINGGEIVVDKQEYDELRRKANAFDLLQEHIRTRIDSGNSTYAVADNEVLMLLTGTKSYLFQKQTDDALAVLASAGKDEAGE